MQHSIVTALRACDRGTLGRTISIAENGGEQASQLLQLIKPFICESCVTGLTGPPGSGKSTLLDGLIAEFRRRGLSVAVIAIDPSSPFSGGAVLGDRCRMSRHQSDDKVYIRSLSARGSVGGLSLGIARVIDVLKVSNFDMILLETVGTGQAEVDVMDLVDICVVVCAPNTGDEVQAIKSGILEIADILVVNKTDLSDTNGTLPQLKMAQHLRRNPTRQVPVVPTIATEDKGIEKLADEILKRSQSAGNTGQYEDHAKIRRRLARGIARALEERLFNQDNEMLDQLCTSIQRHKLNVDEAIRIWLDKDASRQQ